MRTVEVWAWRLRSETTGKVVRARWKMTEAEALARDPAAERVPGTMESRTIYEPGEWSCWDTAQMGLRYPERDRDQL